MKLPILYSFRRCPYAIRTRMTLAYAGIEYELREIVLKNKPAAMLEISPKGTVPVLQLPDQTIMEESIEIMHWALEQNDPEGWRDFLPEKIAQVEMLIEKNDFSFKQHLDHYKYSERHPEQSREVYRQSGEVFLQELEFHLQNSRFLFGEKISIADIAIFPFIRQFSNVDLEWFQSSQYSRLKEWLRYHLESPLFTGVMQKFKPWHAEAPITVFTPF